jgi:hypothetical protein
VFAVVEVVQGLDGGEVFGGEWLADDFKARFAFRKGGWGGRAVGFQPRRLHVAHGFEVCVAPTHQHGVGGAVGVCETMDAGNETEIGGGPVGDGLSFPFRPAADERARWGVLGTEHGRADESHLRAGKAFAVGGDPRTEDGLGLGSQRLGWRRGAVRDAAENAGGSGERRGRFCN